MSEPGVPGAQPSGGTVSSEAVAEAAKCDAAGKHAEAVNHLAVGAKIKDVEAVTQLGKRLLVGDRAPLMANEGAQFLEEAVELGGAEGAAILAVLYAVGASKRHGPERSLEMLSKAAQRGWAPARAQLLVLAGEPGAFAAGATEERDWTALANTVDLTAWLTPPAGTDLSTSPHIRRVPDIVPDGVCRWLIEKARGRLTRALVYEALAKKTTVHASRTNTAATFNLLDTDLVCVLAQLRMAACVDIPFRHLEPLSVLHYEEGQEITEHFDFVDPNVPNYEEQIATRGQRVVTFLIYLNDDYLGGETEFPRVGVSHKGRRGEGLFFVNALDDGAADLRTLHAGRSPASGAKWIVSQFMRDRPTL
jgi:hypothetical protein